MRQKRKVSVKSKKNKPFYMKKERWTMDQISVEVKKKSPGLLELYVNAHHYSHSLFRKQLLIEKKNMKTISIQIKCKLIQINKSLCTYSGLENLQTNRRSSLFCSFVNLNEMVMCLEDLINYFAQPEEDMGKYNY